MQKQPNSIPGDVQILLIMLVIIGFSIFIVTSHSWLACLLRRLLGAALGL